MDGEGNPRKAQPFFHELGQQTFPFRLLNRVNTSSKYVYDYVSEQFQHASFAADTIAGARRHCACAEHFQHGTISDCHTGLCSMPRGSVYTH